MGVIKRIKEESRTNKNRYNENDEPETLTGIEDRIRGLQSRLKVLLTADDSDEKEEQLKITGNEIVFLTRLGNYVEARQRLAPGEVLTATSATGVHKMYVEMKETLNEYEDDPEFAHVIPDLRKNVSYLRDLMIERKRIERKSGKPEPTTKRRKKSQKRAKPKAGEIVKDGKTIHWFTSPDGKKLIKPKRFVLESSADLIFIDEESSGTVNFQTPKHTKPGSVFVVLRMLNPEGRVGFQMIEIHAPEILKARDQRLLLANAMGGTYTAVTLVSRGLGVGADVVKSMQELGAEATKITESARKFLKEVDRLIATSDDIVENAPTLNSEDGSSDAEDNIDKRLEKIKEDAKNVNDEAQNAIDLAKAKNEEAEQIGRAFLKENKEKFLSEFSTDIIERDLMRIIDTYV